MELQESYSKVKIGAANLSKYLHRLVSLIWQKEEISKEWKTGDSLSISHPQEGRQ